MSETALQVQEQAQTAMILTQQDIDTLVAGGILPQGTPEPNVRLFARYCAESKLSPFKRQVHLIKRQTRQGDRYTIQTGIDGYRAIADRTGKYAGNDDPVFDSESEPQKATVTVYKLVGGTRCPFTATARWTEYAPDTTTPQGFMWKKMPHLMLAKCAESLALRKAFPDELGGVYTDEEMQQADAREVKTVEAKILELPQEAQPVKVQNQTVGTEFDPTKEDMTFGKYKGMKWSQADKSYIEWLAKSATKADIKARAEATLRYFNQIPVKAEGSVVDEMFPKGDVDELTGEIKPEPSDEIKKKSAQHSLNAKAAIKTAKTQKTLIEITKRIEELVNSGEMIEKDSNELIDLVDAKALELKGAKK